MRRGARQPSGCTRTTGALLLCLASVGVPRADSGLERYETARLSMGCVYSIAAYSAHRDTLPPILAEALDEVERIDRLMSHYRPDSPLSQLNRDAARGPVRVDRELFDFIATSLAYSRSSEGAFDITVGPLMKLWGFFQDDGRVPTPPELRAVRRHIGYRHVILNAADRTIRFATPGVELDLGGIAKGYAVDRVVRLLRQRGVGAALVSAGGSTVYGFGAPPGQDAWQVGVQDPLDPARVAFTVALRDQALSVAGSSEKFFTRGRTRYGHIMNPRTGRPVQGVLTVAVIALTGVDGDALDDALFVRGIEGSRASLVGQPGVEAYFLLPAPRGWQMLHVRDQRVSMDRRQVNAGVDGQTRQ
jgi:FAD:protein FMN transferase